MSETPLQLQLVSTNPARGQAWAVVMVARLNAAARALGAWAFAGEPVLLLHPDGTQSVWRGQSRRSNNEANKRPRFVAIQLPDDLILWRKLRLPRMAQAHAAEAIGLEVRSNSPFPPEELAWGSAIEAREAGQKHLAIALSSRRHVADFVQNRWPELMGPASQPEVWALSQSGRPVVFEGYGEGRRFHAAAVERRWNWALAVLALALATAAALTPTIQLRERALQASAAFDAVLRRVSPVVRQRDELATLNDRIRALDLIAATRVDPAGVIEYVTRILPDDTYLYSLDVQSTKTIASGFTSNATALLQKLSSDPRLKNVKAPAAVTRQPGAAKEAFVIEFMMEPKPVSLTPAAPASLAGPVATPPAVAPVAPVAAAAASSPAAGMPVPVPAPVAATAQGKRPQPPKAGSSPFVIGGSQ